MSSDPFYRSRDWFKLRSKVKAIWKREQRPCAYCGEPIDWSSRPIADHIKNRKQFPHLALSIANICVVHHACNTKKYHHQEASKKPEIGLDGYPL
jgi:5-methylcytosine-specific restriction endonuclease McrA